MITHMRVHTQEKPFECNYPNCDARFKAHGHLKDHMKKHYNIKPYTCHICSANFSRNSTLKMHLNTHVETKPYQCPIADCKKSFIDKAQIKFHMKSHYPHDLFEKIFEEYLENNKETIEKLIENRKNEIIRKTQNKKPIKPKLPKYIKKGNSYEIDLNEAKVDKKRDNESSTKNKIMDLSFDKFLGAKRNKSEMSKSRMNESLNSNSNE